MKIEIPEQLFPVLATPPITTSSAVVGDYISMKNAHTVYITVVFTNAAAFANVLTLTQATAVAGTSAKAIANVVPIWSNEDIATSDTLVKQTSAVNYTLTADIKNKIVIFKVDAEKLDGANSFDCITVAVDASSEATNFMAMTYHIVPRYGTAPPSFITD